MQSCRFLLRSSARAARRWSTIRATPRSVPLARSFGTIYDNVVRPEDVNRHRSDAEEKIAQVPVIEVDGPTAVCDGGGGALGHPIEYIQLDTVKHGEVQECKYCGLRYKMKMH